MALTLGDNFSYQGSKPLDARLKYSTLAEMKAVSDATMYDGCMAYCVATDKTYQWKSTNTVDETTGKWREFSSGGGGGTSDYTDLTNKPQINNVELSGNKTASNLGLASSADMEKAYKSDDTSFTALADADYVPVYDTSASKAKKSTWSNIKSVLKTYFDTLYNKVTAGTGLSLSGNSMSIKQFASGDMDEVIPELPSVGTKYHQYSTEEQVVGTWIDGSIIYEKTFTGTLEGSSAGTEASTIISMGVSIDNYVDIFGFALSSSGGYHMIPTARFTQSEYRWIRVAASSNSASSNKNTVTIYNAWGSTYNLYNLTVRYTKTT